MGEVETEWLLHRHGFDVPIDYPYQHYQFAGRADVLAWTLDPPALLHIENHTRFPDLQQPAASFNAKRRYLGGVMARELGIPGRRQAVGGRWSPHPDRSPIAPERTADHGRPLR